MGFHVPTAQAFNRGGQQRLQSTVLPAPIEGMDGRLNLASNNPLNCVIAFNLVPSEFGMRTREGFREWQIDVETAPLAGLGVRTIIPFHGTEFARVGDKLFVTTNEGIWDVTADSGTPVLDLAFTIQDDTAGWGVFTHYTLANGDITVFLADSANGLFQYDPVLDTWATASAIMGPVNEDIVFVVVHKQRIWLIEKNATTAWYLPVGSVSGQATEFFFGAKFKHGGDLVGLYNWTQDSGEGIDDVLVAVSRAGDILPWEGEDPSAAATWRNTGTFFIGDVPLGNRIASEYGGDLHLISDFGLVAMSDLMSGISSTPREKTVNLKIARFIRRDMDDLSQLRGWEIRFNTNEGVLLINTPQRLDGEHRQFRVNLAVEGWAFWRDVPMLTSDNYQGALMFGTKDNKVFRMDVPVDNATIAAPGVGDPVKFSMVGNFFDLNQPAQFKWGQFVRPNFLSTQPPAFDTKILYDYITEEITDPGIPIQNPQPSWDNDFWDQAVWASGIQQSFFKLVGQWGPGRTVAMAIRGTATARSTLVSYEMMWYTGGPF